MNRLNRLVVAYLSFILNQPYVAFPYESLLWCLSTFKIAGFAMGTEQSLRLFRNILRTTVSLAYQTTVGERGNGAGEWD